MGRGAEGAHIANIVHAFEQLGHTVTVVSPPGVNPLAEVGGKPLDKTEEKVSGITRLWKMISRHAPQFIFEFLEILYNFSAIRKISKAIDCDQIDFIYERSAFFLFAGAYISRRKQIPLIIEANEAVGIQRARKLIMRRVAKAIEKYTFNRSLAIFTVSSYLANLIRENASDGTKIHVAPNCIDPANFSKKTKRNEIRARYNVSDKIVLGFAGWFDWWDRLDILISIQDKLLKEGYSNVHTMLIGSGNMIDDLKVQRDNLKISNNVTLTGPVNKKDVLDYIDALDIGVLPHSNEFGSPMILFEMMALGKCVVAPALAPITDVIKDGINGVIFPVLNEQMLHAKICEVISDNDKRQEIGKRSMSVTFKHYTWGKNAEKIIAAINGSQKNYVSSA